ncbi:helix-turn-helix domain-containing protein [Tabrizicola fusiformis]|uniref:helix-turn-helix domain-containing protein n=1 Tax=Tabrizicola sp. SY72 TaxID=2741673 RepID=UPI00157332E5|nr:helix-turn-helix domain-containing protein [Tabrizicola sp. SY72]
MADHVTISAIVDLTGVNRTTVLRYLKALTAAGYLKFQPGPAGKANAWVLIKDVGHHAPRVRADGSAVTQGAITMQLWRAMTMLKEFSYVDLVQHASIEIPEATSKDYCKRLLAAGYLRVLVKADPSAARIARYRLIRASGPKAPQVQRVRQVFDPNTGTAYPSAGDTQ